MKRWENLIVTIDVKSLTEEEKTEILTDIIESNIEIDCQTEDIYVKNERTEFFLNLMKEKKAKLKANLPDKWVKTDKTDGIIDKNNKRYEKLTEENLNDAEELYNTIPDVEISKSFLESMLLVDLKIWIKERGIDDDVDLRKSKANIILAVLKLENGYETENG